MSAGLNFIPLYCCVMQDDPLRYWRDLTENYRQMGDGELRELAARPEELTEVAQQVLRDEIRTRGLDKPQPSPASRRVSSIGYHQLVDRTSGDQYIPSEPDDPDEDTSGEEPSHEYTWKTLLCDCESNDQAWQLREVLKRHGIEGWTRNVSPYSTDTIGPQVYVAADQLEQAKAIAAQPIPQDIIDEWNTAIPEFELPACPRCGSKEGTILESTDPVNAWVCESCGAEWNDPETAPDGQPEGRETSAP